MSKTITIQGQELARREEVTLGGLRKLMELEAETGCQFSTGKISPSDLMKLFAIPDGPVRLLGILCSGPLDKLDFDEIPVSQFAGMLQDFFVSANGKKPLSEGS